jgi:hypothetical protein
MGWQGVIMAGQDDAVFACVVGQVFPMRLRVLCLQFNRSFDRLLEPLVRPALLSGVIDARFFNVFPLPLTRGVIHERDQAN